MALFGSRNSSAATGSATTSASRRTGGDELSVDDLRKQAKRRLIGALVLVLVAVFGFPLLFDTNPRAPSEDVHIEMPDKTKVRLVPPESVPNISAHQSQPDISVSVPATPARSLPLPQAPAAADYPKKPVEKAPVSTPSLEEDKPNPKDKDAVANSVRYVVQVGAFVEEDRVREVRAKLERAGLKTYIHIATTKEGKRTRVRVGPYPEKAQAIRIAEKIKSLQLPVSILEL